MRLKFTCVRFILKKIKFVEENMSRFASLEYRRIHRAKVESNILRISIKKETPYSPLLWT